MCTILENSSVVPLQEADDIIQTEYNVKVRSGNFLSQTLQEDSVHLQNDTINAGWSIGQCHKFSVCINKAKLILGIPG